MSIINVYNISVSQEVCMVSDVFHSNFRFETVNVNLANKPTWLFERNPNGKVPILEIGDKVNPQKKKNIVDKFFRLYSIVINISYPKSYPVGGSFLICSLLIRFFQHPSAHFW